MANPNSDNLSEYIKKRHVWKIESYFANIRLENAATGFNDAWTVQEVAQILPPSRTVHECERR